MTSRSAANAHSRSVVLAIPYHHSDLEHGARGLLAAGVDARLLVPHDTNRSLAIASRFLPPGNPIRRTLAMRAYDPPGKSVAAASALYHAALLRLGRGTKATMNWRYAFDRAVAREITAQPPAAFVGLTASSVRSIKAARRASVPTFDYYNGDYGTMAHGFERELAAARTPRERDEIRLEMPPPGRARAKDTEIALSDFFIVESLNHERALAARGVESPRIIRVGQGVDATAFTVAERDASARPLRVIHVGSVGYRKGLRWLCEAAAASPATIERVDVVGYVLARASELQRLAPPNVHFRGEVPHSQLKDLYASADVFVLTSFAEGMARVVFEAMACGLPVVVTPDTGYEGVMTDGVEGFFVPPFDAAAIAEKLSLLAQDGELRQRMGRAARVLAETYTWARFEGLFVRGLLDRVPALARA